MGYPGRAVFFAVRRLGTSVASKASAIQIDRRTSSALIVLGTGSLGTRGDRALGGLRYVVDRLAEYE